MGNFNNPDIAIDHRHLESVDRLVLSERNVVLSKVMGGIDISSRAEDDTSKVKWIAEQNIFDDAVKACDINPTRHHFEEHEIYFMSYQFDHLLHFGMTTGHNMMNVARAINARSLFFNSDGCFNVCRQSLCVIGFRVGMLGGVSASAGFSVNPSESAEAFRATFNGLDSTLESAFHQLF